MPAARKARAIGFNHVAIEVGDIDAALEFYGRLAPVPILVMLLVSTGLFFASQYIFARKEMK